MFVGVKSQCMVDEDGSPVVLIAEDEDSLREMYSTRLEMSDDNDFDIRLADGGEEAVDIVDDEVDVALLDRRMPHMTGDEVLDHIDELDVEIRTAMVTAVEPDYDIVDMPFDTYLVKPVSQDELVDTVNDLLKRKQYEDRVQELFTLMSKKAVLEGEKSKSELENSQGYIKITTRIEELQDDIQDDMDEMEDKSGYSGFHDELEGVM